MDLGVIIIIGIALISFLYQIIKDIISKREKRWEKNIELDNRVFKRQKEQKEKNDKIIRDFVINLISKHNLSMNKDKRIIYIKLFYDNDAYIIKFNEKIIDRIWHNTPNLIRYHLLISQFYIWNEYFKNKNESILEKIKNPNKYKFKSDLYNYFYNFMRDAVLLTDNIFKIPDNLLSGSEAENNNNLPLDKIISDEFFKDTGIKRPF